MDFALHLEKIRIGMILDAFDSALCIFARFVLNSAFVLGQETELREDLAREERADVRDSSEPYGNVKDKGCSRQSLVLVL